MVPIDVTLVVVVVEGSFLEECLRRGSPHPACFNGERNKGDMCGIPSSYIDYYSWYSYMYHGQCMGQCF